MRIISGAIAFVLFFPFYIPFYIVGASWDWIKTGFEHGKDHDFLG